MGQLTSVLPAIICVVQMHNALTSQLVTSVFVASTMRVMESTVQSRITVPFPVHAQHTPFVRLVLVVLAINPCQSNNCDPVNGVCSPAAIVDDQDDYNCAC